METQTAWQMVYQIDWAQTKGSQWANLKLTDSQTADYWALHLQMETQRGLKWVRLMMKELHSEVSLALLTY